MFFGNWNFNFNYKKGNIIYIPYHKQYYICIKDHSSSEAFQIYPPETPEYWIHIDSIFLNSYLLSNTMSGILFEFANENYKLINKCEENENENANENDIEIFKSTLLDEIEKEMNEDTNTNDETNDIKEKRKDIEIILITPPLPSNNSSTVSKKLKRKLDSIENKIQDYKKKKLNTDVDDLRDKLLLLNLDIPTKSFLLDKYDNTKRLSGSDYTKSMNWLKSQKI